MNPKELSALAQADFDHNALVRHLAKPGNELISALDEKKAELVHMAFGLASEAGELATAIKAHWVYGKNLDITNVREELGDIEFFMARIRQLLFLTRGEVLAENIAKLRKRYPSGYRDEDGIARKDKAE